MHKITFKDIEQPLVSICCITFNHRPFIAKAIEGFLSQETTFPYEIIIHDDASYDGTAEIVKKYDQQNLGRFRNIYQKENQWSKGIKPSAEIVWPYARGKYIALCEGDDYWTDPYKLQKQVDFLEQHEDYCISHHRANVLKNDKFEDDYLNNSTPDTTTVNDLSEGNYIRTPSVVFRNPFLNEFPDYYMKSPIGDYPLYMLILDHFKGKIRYFDEPMCVYRIHEGGIWESKPRKFRIEQSARMLELLIQAFKGESFVRNFIYNHHNMYWECYIKEKNQAERIAFLQKAVMYTDKNINKLIDSNKKMGYYFDKIRSNKLYKSYIRLKKLL